MRIRSRAWALPWKGALRGQPCRNAVLAFGGAAVWVTSLWRHVCKGKGLLCSHRMPLPASAPNYGRKCLAFQLGQKQTMSLLQKTPCPECLKRLSLSWTWCSPGATLPYSNPTGKAWVQSKILLLSTVNDFWVWVFVFAFFTVTRSPTSSGRNFNQSLPWTRIFSHFHT